MLAQIAPRGRPAGSQQCADWLADGGRPSAAAHWSGGCHVVLDRSRELGLRRGGPAFAARMRGRLRPAVQVRRVLTEHRFRPRPPVRTSVRGGGNLTLVDVNEPAIKLVSSTSFRLKSQPRRQVRPHCVTPMQAPTSRWGWLLPRSVLSHQAGVPAQPGATGTARRTQRLQRDGKDDAAEAGRGRVR